MTKLGLTTINTIQMAVQTAEHHLRFSHFTEQLQVSLSLLTIARGSCMMTIRPDGQRHQTPIGHLHIPVDRAVIQASVSIAQSDFDDLAIKLARPVTRPTSVVVTLDTELTVDDKGFLFLDQPIDTAISEIFWIMPLK